MSYASWGEYAAGEDDNLGPRVCLTHMRRNVCRSPEPHEWSEAPEDLDKVFKYNIQAVMAQNRAALDRLAQ